MDPPAKISGYLEKKGSLKVLSSWKKYWFVLEGQLLLYYRSKDEYEGIGACKGSINLCPPCFIKPCSSEKCVFRIEKKTSSITLKAENRTEQDKWMQGLLMALKSHSSSQSRLSHYRFSACEFGPLECQKPLQRHMSLPTRYNRNDAKTRHQLAENLRKTEVRTNSIHLPKNKLVQRYGSGGRLYASVGDTTGDGDDGDDKRSSFVVENDIYGTCGKLSVCYEGGESSERGSSCSDGAGVAAEHHVQRRRRRSFSAPENHASDYEYSSIEIEDQALKHDHNKNTIVIENDQYVSALLSENFGGGANLTEEAIYEEIDKIREKLGFASEDDRVYAAIESKDEEAEGRFKKTLLRRKKRDEKRRGLKKRRSFFGKIVHKWKKRRRVEMDQQEIDRNVKLLLELQHILTQRKAALEQIRSKNEEGPTDVPRTDDSASFEPALPPKTSHKHPSPFHDTPKNNKIYSLPSEKSEPPQKSIDEILEDLNNEETRPNVKNLIERFSGHKDEEEVVLRRQRQIAASAPRHSDDLNELLEKLGEMRVAPPMQPGVTTSLATPPVSDEEWLKLLPIRKRRLSDPDYDIPRPHRSLIFEPKIENPENVIPATRFFGPVLQSSDFQEISKNSNVNSSSTYVSISPDSLEIVEKSDEVRNASYTSHFYVEERSKHYDQVVFVHSKWTPVENDSITSTNEIFVDSLESTTAF